MAEIKQVSSGKLFQNKFLEMLTRAHPVFIMSIYLPLCIFLLWYFHNWINPSPRVLVFVFIAGLFTWTFIEYILHRFVFHMEGESPFIKKFQYMIHGIHHKFPRDKERLVMPPVPSIIISAIFFFFFKAILGVLVYAFFSGFMIGYLIYAFIHYATHAFRPPKNLFHFLWEYHALHHFKYSDKAFGVSSPLWDYIFNTVPPERKKQNALVDRRTDSHS